tara:strand:+ start:1667 stop:1855 length:189 start_codon:yes stop_codon:yes gene_type:complete
MGKKIIGKRTLWYILVDIVFSLSSMRRIRLIALLAHFFYIASLFKVYNFIHVSAAADERPPP